MSGVLRRIERVGILGDVHAEDVRLARAYRAFDQYGVDAVLCVGDLVDGPGDADACIELLLKRGALIVAGNHERWFLADEMRNLPLATAMLERQNADILATLPATMDLETRHGRLRLAHGIGEDDMAELRPDTRGYALQATGLRELMLEPGLTYHVGGHTHVRMARAFPGLVVLNPGTLTGEEGSAMMVDFAERSAVHVDVTTDELRVLERVNVPEPMPLGES